MASDSLTMHIEGRVTTKELTRLTDTLLKLLAEVEKNIAESDGRDMTAHVGNDWGVTVTMLCAAKCGAERAGPTYEEIKESDIALGAFFAGAKHDGWAVEELGDKRTLCPACKEAP